MKAAFNIRGGNPAQTATAFLPNTGRSHSTGHSNLSEASHFGIHRLQESYIYTKKPEDRATTALILDVPPALPI